MNVPMNVTTQVPAHLQHLVTGIALNDAMTAGLSTGGWPRISIKASRFRLQSPQGEEVVVQTPHLDVIIVDANPHGKSKIYYAGKYDPGTDPTAPDCFSDNGVGPSSKAAKPQCGTCAACPNNVIGSKINPSGSKTTACADVKKLAVLIADNPDGPVFELRVPAASLSNLGNYAGALAKRGYEASLLVTRLGFDTNADYPKLTFAAQGWISADQAEVVKEVRGTEEVDQCTGRNDKPYAGAPITLAAPLPQSNGLAQLPSQPRATAPRVVESQPAPLGMHDPEDGFAAQMAEKPKRTRRTKAEMAAQGQAGMQLANTSFVDQGAAPQAAQALQQETPAFLRTRAPAHGAVLNPPQVTDAALDDLISRAMGV